MVFFFFKQKTAYEIYQCDWSSDVCSSDLIFGFEAFSNARGVFKQVLPFSGIELMMAPFTKFKQLLIDLSIKYL